MAILAGSRPMLNWVQCDGAYLLSVAASSAPPPKEGNYQFILPGRCPMAEWDQHSASHHGWLWGWGFKFRPGHSLANQHQECCSKSKFLVCAKPWLLILQTTKAAQVHQTITLLQRIGALEWQAFSTCPGHDLKLPISSYFSTTSRCKWPVASSLAFCAQYIKCVFLFLLE